MIKYTTFIHRYNFLYGGCIELDLYKYELPENCTAEEAIRAIKLCGNTNQAITFIIREYEMLLESHNWCPV